MLLFFFCVSGGGGVQIRARTRAPSWEGGTSFCHTRATAGKFTRGGQRRGSAGRSPLTCRARTLKVHRREPPGTARVCCGPLRRARLPPPSRPQRFNHRIRTTTALWCVRNPGDDFFSPACGIPPPRRCAGGFPQTTGAAEIDSGAESQAFAWARLAPTLVGPAGSNCRWLDSSGYIGNLCSRETGLNFYISNEMGRVSASPFRPPRRFRLGAEFGIRREGLIFPNLYSLRLLQLIRVNHSSL